MPTPTFRGQALFGTAPVVIPAPNPPRLQLNAYPGVNGRDAVWGGSDGGETVAEFVLVAPNEATLASYKAVWITLVANAAIGTLVDTAGTSWTNVVAQHFAPAEEIKPAPSGGVSQRCRVMFTHLL